MIATAASGARPPDRGERRGHCDSRRGALLVPLPTATDDHQRRNAEVIARVGGAEVIDERELFAERLADAIAAIAGDRERQGRMSAAMRTLARPDAASRIADRAGALALTIRRSYAMVFEMPNIGSAHRR